MKTLISAIAWAIVLLDALIKHTAMKIKKIFAAISLIVAIGCQESDTTPCSDIYMECTVSTFTGAQRCSGEEWSPNYSDQKYIVRSDCSYRELIESVDTSFVLPGIRYQVISCQK